MERGTAQNIRGPGKPPTEGILLHVRRILKTHLGNKREESPFRSVQYIQAESRYERTETNKRGKASLGHRERRDTLFMSGEPKMTLRMMVQQPEPRSPCRQGNIHTPTKRWGWASPGCGHHVPKHYSSPQNLLQVTRLSRTREPFSSAAKRSTHLLPAWASLIPAAQTNHFKQNIPDYHPHKLTPAFSNYL